MFSNKSPKLIGLVQAFGLMFYITLVVSAMNLIGENDYFKNEALAGITMLMLFVASALISASVILGYPIVLFFSEKERRSEAIRIVIWSAVWLLAFVIFLMAFALVWNYR